MMNILFCPRFRTCIAVDGTAAFEKRLHVAFRESRFPENFHTVITELRLHAYNGSMGVAETEGQLGHYYIALGRMRDRLEHPYRSEMGVIEHFVECRYSGRRNVASLQN